MLRAPIVGVLSLAIFLLRWFKARSVQDPKNNNKTLEAWLSG